MFPRNYLLFIRLVVFFLPISFIHAQTNWVVNSIDDVDDGTCDAAHCSLREAINSVNTNVGADIISFAIPGAAPYRIEPISPLPALTDAETVIDGTTQTAYALGDIIIDGTNTAPKSHGLDVSASNTEIYGLKIINFDISNNAGINIGANNQLSDIIIGAPGKSNIVGDCHQGIFVNFSSNCNNVTIQSNYVGVDPTAGMADIGNEINGIAVMQGVCANILIGGDGTQGEGNIVGFNSDGIRIRVEGAVVQGNFVGTDESGTMDLGNTGFGVNLDDAPGTPNNCLIGGAGPGQGNTIAFNSVGIFKFSSAATNRFQRNSLFCNGAGIQYQSSTTNGTAPPAVLCVSTGLVEGKAAPNTIIEVFQIDNTAFPANTACQGTIYLGEDVTDANGDWSVPVSLNIGDIVGATATDLTANTSTFGNCTIVENEIIAVAGNAGPFCQGSVVELFGADQTGRTGLSFAWTGPDNYTSNSQNPTTATAPGMYYLEVTDNTCGRSIDSTLVEISPSIMITIGDDPSEILCPTGSILVNGTTYDISNPTGTEMQAGQAGACDTVLNVQLQFYPVAEGTLDTMICAGGMIDFNGTQYDESNPTGTERLVGQATNGCDSIVAVSLTFIPASQSTLDTVVCTGGSITVNGTVYDENNTTGSETLVGQAANGCDSIVAVNLSFLPLAMGNLDTMICETGNILINGTVYDVNNATGVERLVGEAANGCDSMLNVSLSFIPAGQSTLDTTVCEGGTILFNGTLYDQNNTSGTERLVGQSASGCDSIVEVNLSFFPLAEGMLDTTICATANFIFNGTTYDANNTMGAERLIGQAANGCDSLVNIQVNFFPAAEGELLLTACEGGSIPFNGTDYDASNTSGTEILVGQAANGCDSIVNVQLSFFPPAEGDFFSTICSTDTVVVNGTDYHANNTNGIEILPGQAANGCDSLVNVLIDFFPTANGIFEPIICEGGSISFNGTEYDANNSTGTEVLEGQAVNGCDSIVAVSISFFPTANGIFEPAVCDGGSILFNGTQYDINNSSGVETLVGEAANGCDSIVAVNLSFLPPITSTVSETFCSGFVLMVNGTAYDENNPTGTEVLQGAAANGCDSTVTIALQFISTVEVDLNQTLCPGQSIQVNGQVYDENNPTGTELIPGGAGVCDSLVTIDLSFIPEATGDLLLSICPESEISINGTIYDMNNPSGTEVLIGQSVNGCDSILNVQLTFEGLASNVKAFPPSCFGEADGIINVESLTGGLPPYSISLNGGPFQPMSNFPFNLPGLAAGDYTIAIKDVNDCLIEQQINVPVPTELEVALGEDVSIRLGDSVQLEALTNLPGLTVSWDPPTDLSCSDCLTPIAKPLATTIYRVEISNNNNCATSDDIRIVVDPDPPIYVANAFSPNGDGVNDFFLVQADGIIQNINYFRVFDRWGSLLFERENFSPNSQDNAWDGQIRGQTAPVGVYVYFVEIVQPNGRLYRFNGDVLLTK